MAVQHHHQTSPTTLGPATSNSNATQGHAFYSSSTTYPRPFSVRGKLPAVDSSIERIMCVGRIWIFLVLGVLLLVLGLVSIGIYLNISELSSSVEYVEIMPIYIPSALVLLAGLCVNCLFWKRYRYLVLVSVGVNVTAGFLCVLVAVLTITHVLQPFRTFTRCRYYVSQSLCQCFSPYNRDVLSLKFSETEETKYDFETVSSCHDVEDILPLLLYSLAVVFCIVFLIAVLSAILALLVLRAERNKRSFLGADSYEEVYTVSGSSQDQSDSEAEVAPEVTTFHQGHTTTFTQGQSTLSKNSLPLTGTLNSTSGRLNSTSGTLNSTSGRLNSTSGTLNSTSGRLNSTSGTLNSTSGRLNSTSDSGYTHSNYDNTSLKRPVTTTSNAAHLVNENQPNLSTIQSNITRSTTPGPRSTFDTPQRSRTPGGQGHDLDKVNLANRYRIVKTPDRDVIVRHRLSKTPDRELGSNRRYSLTQTGQRLSKSCESLDSVGDCERETTPGGKRKSKLREHRRKGKRAATVHTLDTDQLLLILNLQMRFLQESKDHESNNNNNTGNLATGASASTRRAITPQPISQKTVIPQKVRSHTPQPRRANGKIRDTLDNSMYCDSGAEYAINRDHAYRQLVNKNRNRSTSSGNNRSTSSANSSRRSSESSDRNFELVSSGGGINTAAGGILGQQPPYLVYGNQGDTECHNNSGGNQFNLNYAAQTEGECHSNSGKEYNPTYAAQTAPNIKQGYNPYIHNTASETAPTPNGDPSGLHYVTYSDSMLSKNLGAKKHPKSRASVQDHFLPPQPIHRGAHQELPPQPISRQKNVDHQLPPQPVHRSGGIGASSAFHIVDRGGSGRASKSRSPSVNSDRAPALSSADVTRALAMQSAKAQQSTAQNLITSTPRRKNKKSNYAADVAIRENFSLNPKPGKDSSTLLQSSASLPHQHHGSMATTSATNNPDLLQQTSHTTNSNFILRDRNSDRINSEQVVLSRDRNNSEDVDILPPYSGPPSYKEYVSSCNTSVTSSLSSNPDDLYGMPRRRVRKDSSGKMGDNAVLPGQSNTEGFDARNTGNLYKLSGPRGSIGHGQGQSGEVKVTQEKVQGQRSKGEGQEAIYSRPSNSKVKQYIVPEDYYTTISKVPRRDATYQNSSLDTMPQMDSRDFNDSGEYLGQEHEYGNVARQLSGYEYRSSSRPDKGSIAPDKGQIGPDDKYSNDYEDVYGTYSDFNPDYRSEIYGRHVDHSTPRNNKPSEEQMPAYSMSNPANSSANPHADFRSKSVMNSANTHTDPKTKSTNSNNKAKTKPKSPPKKHRSGGYNHISDVFASNGASGSSTKYSGNSLQSVQVNRQVSDSVENVHAEIMGKIPQIKLNDREVVANDREVVANDRVVVVNDRQNETMDDDDVFVDDDAKMYEIASSVVNKSTTDQSNIHLNQNYEEINDLDVADEFPVVRSHVTDVSANQEAEYTDDGYMKMTYPGKHAHMPNSENYGIAISLTGHSTNQKAVNNHVVTVPTNQGIVNGHMTHSTNQISENSHMAHTSNQNSLNGHVVTDSTNQDMVNGHMTGVGCRGGPDGEDGPEADEGNRENFEETGV